MSYTKIVSAEQFEALARPLLLHLHRAAYNSAIKDAAAHLDRLGMDIAATQVRITCPMTVTFVWRQGNRGPKPEIWHHPVASEGNPVPCLAKHVLTDEEAQLSLAELIARYPAPQAKQ